MSLLTLSQVAERLQCSRSHLRDLILAADYERAPVDRVPPRLRPLVALRFPKPRYLSASRRMARVDERELMNWLEQRG